MPKKAPIPAEFWNGVDPEVSAAFRATGSGWQTRIDAALKEWLKMNSVNMGAGQHSVG